MTGSFLSKRTSVFQLLLRLTFFRWLITETFPYPEPAEFLVSAVPVVREGRTGLGLMARKWTDWGFLKSGDWPAEEETRKQKVGTVSLAGSTSWRKAGEAWKYAV